MKIETLAIHAGFQPDPTTHSVATPLYQTTSYASTTPSTGRTCSTSRWRATSTPAS